MLLEAYTKCYQSDYLAAVKIWRQPHSAEAPPRMEWTMDHRSGDLSRLMSILFASQLAFFKFHTRISMFNM